MKTLFYTGLILLAIFEFLKVYFIMPMPGSQEINTIDVAYFLHHNRWLLRGAFLLMIAIGAFRAFQIKRKWIPVVALIPVIVIVYFFNFKMTAERIFREPESLVFKGRADNFLNDSTVVIAVAHAGEAKGYPIRFIVYHHQVRDTIGGRPIMVTYCSVCRTGRVYEPIVNGAPETFRLVGMDHFNAMFEDEKTKSWWRQSTGEAVTGSLKGVILPEVESIQVSTNKFFSLYPFGKIMQAETETWPKYDSLGRFEKGKSKGKLTRKDTLAWHNKSWIVGLQLGKNTKAYDWDDLKNMEVINDKIGGIPVMLTISSDGASFAAFERSSEDETFSILNDSLISNKSRYDFSGKDGSGNKLKRVKAYQEFWHSWKTFHPETEIYKNETE
jgi:hypothetical protein